MRRVTRVTLAIEQGWRDLGEPYLLGAKPHLVQSPQRVPGPRDCSGEIRLMVAAAGVTHVHRRTLDRTVPVSQFNGSVVQWECCRDIRDKRYWWSVGHLLFIVPRGNRVGHVAMVLAPDPHDPSTGWTLEARGGAERRVTIVGPEENLRRGWQRCGKLPELFKAL